MAAGAPPLFGQQELAVQRYIAAADPVDGRLDVCRDRQYQAGADPVFVRFRQWTVRRSRRRISPYSDVTTTSGTSYPNSNGGGGIGWQTTPDFTGRVLWKQDWGLIALRGVVRPEITLNNEGASAVNQQFKQTTSGYGVGITGNVQVIPGRFILMASGNAGNGLGRYLDSTANGYGAVSNFGIPGSTLASTSGINAVGVYGGMVGAQMFFTPLLRSNMAIGGARLILPSYTSQFGGCVGSASAAGTCSGTNTSEYAASINLVWSPFKAVDIGLEYQYVARNLQQRAVTGSGLASSGGIANRIELTAIGGTEKH